MKVKICLPDWYNERHRSCILKTLELLNGAEIQEAVEDGVIVEVTQDALEILRDMCVCDYLTLVELDQMKSLVAFDI